MKMVEKNGFIFGEEKVFVVLDLVVVVGVFGVFDIFCIFLYIR